MALTTNKNFLSPVGFTFKLDATNFANTEYFCTQVTMPGISLAEAVVPYRGLNLSMTGDRLSFEDLAIRFNVTENMENYIEIFNWLHDIVTTGGTENQFKFDATLMIMSSHNNLNKSIRFKDVFPTGQPDFVDELNYETQDPAELTMTYRCDHWVEENVGA